MKKKMILLALSLGVIFGAMAQTTPAKSETKSKKQVEVPMKKHEKAPPEPKNEKAPVKAEEKKTGSHRHHAKQKEHKS